MKYLFCTLFVFFSLIVYSDVVKPYEWEKNRSRYVLTAEENAFSEYMIKNHVQYDYTLEESQFLMYATIHRIVLVNNNEAIQKHNRIYISMHNTIELIDLRARAISRDGKVVNFDRNNLKEIQEEGGNKSYRIFAIEGVETGSEIEYFYTRKMKGVVFERIYTQGEIPVRNNSFLLTSPSHLLFDFKTYHGYPAVKKEDSEERNVYSVTVESTPGLTKEPFSYFDANRKRIEFKLAFNTARSKARLYTWDEAAKNFYERLATLSKDEEKALDKYYAGLNDKVSEKIELRVRSIEQKVKTTIQIDENASGESVNQLHLIAKYKIASREGVTKFLFALFNKAKIPVHLVVTCNRENGRFDGSFDSWAYLDDYLLYFPDTQGFLAPYSFEYRYPFVPSHFTAHQGLFVEPFVMGAVKSGLGSVKEIPPTGYEANFDNLDIHVSFNKVLSGNSIKQTRSFGGYSAAYFTPYFPLMKKEDKASMVEDLIRGTAPDAEISSWSASPLNRGIYDDFVINAEFTSAHFLEKAGPRLLFKVGELIGSQTEMYSDHKRETPVENEFNRLYDRKIIVELPQGYTIRNPDDIKFNVVMQKENKQPFAFISDYTLRDGILEITIHEYYMEIDVPVEGYEDFRKVVNAAADFNKVTLVLEKVR
jgi:hypothetical protein